jgi:hypothetical protein
MYSLLNESAEAQCCIRHDEDPDTAEDAARYS